MALIDFPRVALSAFSIRKEVPGQQIYRGHYAASTQVLARGVAYWAGSISFPLAEPDSHEAKAVEAFISALDSGANTFDLPIPTDDQSSRFTGAVQAVGVNLGGTSVELTLDTAADAAAGIGLRQGDWITIGTRLYQCLSVQSAEQVVVTPGQLEVALPAAIEFAAPKERARARLESSTGITLTREPDYYGPWTIPWESAQ